MLNSLSTLRACAYDLCLVQGVGRPHQSGPITSNHTRGEGEYSSNQRPAVTTVVSQDDFASYCTVHSTRTVPRQCGGGAGTPAVVFGLEISLTLMLVTSPGKADCEPG